MAINENINVSEPKSIDVDDPSIKVEKSLDQTNMGSSKQGTQRVRIGGFFGKTYTIKKKVDKLVYEKATTLDNDNKTRQVDASKIDSTSPLNLKKPDIPKYWSPSESIKKDNAVRKRVTFISCSGCGTQLKEKDIKS